MTGAEPLLIAAAVGGQEQLKASSELAAAQQAKRDEALRSAQLAQIGKSGVQLSDSALNLVQRTAAEQEIDVLTQKYNTAIGLSDLEQEAKVAKFEGTTGAVSSLLKVETLQKLTSVPDIVATLALPLLSETAFSSYVIITFPLSGSNTLLI